jgi:uncharacterized protein (DUF362 family)
VTRFGLDSSDVAITDGDSRCYAESSGENAFHEVLARLGALLGWSAGEASPFGAAIADGARVLVKPNWVRHKAVSGSGKDCLVTNANLVKAAVRAALATRAESVIVGDAPVQACDFDALLTLGGLATWADDLRARDKRFKGIVDFRRTTSQAADGTRIAEDNRRPLERYVMFDLRERSRLHAIGAQASRFRVTCYDPSILARTHGDGRHEYLIAREAIEADVVINLPKLKTHKKAGMTGALKNMVGTVGSKDYLPHHRKGGSAGGGDCYPGRSWVKGLWEFFLDRENSSTKHRLAAVWARAARIAGSIARRLGDNVGVEGSWHGNDTVWRMTLDLDSIITYGTAQGTMAPVPQRRILTIMDAIIAGQGEGPLSPNPYPVGLVLASENLAAADWVGAELLGYNPERIPLVVHAFDRHPDWPIAEFSPDAIRRVFVGEGASTSATVPARPPAGWSRAMPSTYEQLEAPARQSNVDEEA